MSLENRNAAPTSKRGYVVHGKLGTVPFTFRFYRHYVLVAGRTVVYRDPMHCSKWHKGVVTNVDPLRIAPEATR